MSRRALLAFAFACSVWSPAAHPQEPTRPTYRLAPALDPLLADPLLREAKVAVQVVDLATGEEVWAIDGDRALVPASVTKVVTSAAALRALGPTFRWSTELLRDGEINDEGVLEGDLYIRGSGDPTFVIEKMWKLLQDLQLAGVVEINGDIVFDEGFFDQSYLIPGWDKKTDVEGGPGYFAPVNALPLNFNTAALVITPAAVKDAPARVELETRAGAIAIENTTVTVSEKKRGWIGIEREVDPRTQVVTFKVEGDVPLRSEVQRHYRAVGSPLAWFMSATQPMIKSAGIKYTGKFRTGETPDAAIQIVELKSPPLHEILNHTNKYSSNFMAEIALKTMGAVKKGRPGTTAKGVQVVNEYLAGIGVPVKDLQIVNGSGLSHETWMAPSHINAVLMDMWHDPRLRHEFFASLAVGGVDGTLRGRFGKAEHEGLVRGKTGSLSGVYCLAAVVEGGDGRSYGFTFLVNDLDRTRPARAMQDQLGEAILSWTGAPQPVAP